MTFVALLLLCSISISIAQPALVINPKNSQDSLSNPASLPIDISDLFNNRAFATHPNGADFDGHGSGYPAQFLPSSTLFSSSGVDFILPRYNATGNDNLVAMGQIIHPPQGRYLSVQMLAAADSITATGYLEATYSDNTTTVAAVVVDPFWEWPYPLGGEIIFPYYLTNETINYNRSMIYSTINWLDSTKELVKLRLPNVSSSPSGVNATLLPTRFHVFSLSMVSANATTKVLDVQYARSTNMWIEGTNKTQIVEVTVNNIGSEWILAGDQVRINVLGPCMKTLVPGVINRLRPGDQAIVQVGVESTNGAAAGTQGPATVLICGKGMNITHAFNATCGIPAYQSTYESIYSHEAPMWYKNAKFGIIMHWGIYSVPAWGNAGWREAYAEWYWWDTNEGQDSLSQTYQYNLGHYGKEWVYDDFIQNFTVSAFDPKEWVDLFVAAGAQYMVPVSKHHDGYALFDLPSNVSNRTSVKQVPHKNLIQMLFDAAEQYQPNLHKAIYYSLPEWYNPDWAPFGFGSWPGGLAKNPYTNATEPYTGWVPVNNYVSDLILPSMLTLAHMGAELMWCDVGGANLSLEFATEFFNYNAARGKQVAMNNRCGIPGDFEPLEYARYETAKVRKWEDAQGMDPFSWGFNQATPAAAYSTPEQLITTIVDVVSKNGNFLLDIGPHANGTIADVEKDHLLAIGKWLSSHAEAIYNTTYWFISAQEGDAVRFTQTVNSFYILTLRAPNATLTLDSPVPYQPGDQVTVVGGKMAGTIVPSRLLGNGSLQLTIGDAIKNADEHSWVFKIPFGGFETNQTLTTPVRTTTSRVMISATSTEPATTMNAAKVVGSIKVCMRYKQLNRICERWSTMVASTSTSRSAILWATGDAAVSASITQNIVMHVGCIPGVVEASESAGFNDARDITEMLQDSTTRANFCEQT